MTTVICGSLFAVKQNRCDNGQNSGGGVDGVKAVQLNTAPWCRQIGHLVRAKTTEGEFKH